MQTYAVLNGCSLDAFQLCGYDSEACAHGMVQCSKGTSYMFAVLSVATVEAYDCTTDAVLRRCRRDAPFLSRLVQCREGADSMLPYCKNWCSL